MRIIEGELAGRHIVYHPRTGQRVTSEKVRKAAFDILRGYTDVQDARVLDLFAGSGLYGFESLSRGADSCVFVEASREGVKLLKETAQYFGIQDRVQVLCRKVERFLSENDQEYDIVFVDPPYFDFRYESLTGLGAHLAPGGIVVLEGPRKGETLRVAEATLLEERTYGDTVLYFYQKN